RAVGAIRRDEGGGVRRGVPAGSARGRAMRRPTGPSHAKQERPRRDRIIVIPSILEYTGWTRRGGAPAGRPPRTTSRRIGPDPGWRGIDELRGERHHDSAGRTVHLVCHLPRRRARRSRRGRDGPALPAPGPGGRQGGPRGEGLRARRLPKVGLRDARVLLP